MARDSQNPRIVRRQEPPMSILTEPTAAPSPRKIDQVLAHYGESHRDPRNEKIHFVAIPLIMISLVGLLFSLHPWVAYGFLLASLVYYARLSLVWLVTMACASVLMLAVVFAMGERTLIISLLVFVAAWIAQFVGHKLEGRKPSFFEDLQYLWVGPIFVLSKLFLKLGIRW
jgi:uncharacterized membrane protein YGL010W